MEKAVRRRHVSNIASVVKNILFGFLIDGLKRMRWSEGTKLPCQYQNGANIAKDAKTPDESTDDTDEDQFDLKWY